MVTHNAQKKAEQKRRALALTKQGLLTREIADAVGVSDRTVNRWRLADREETRARQGENR